ncbi:MAG: ExbD/TolR family protein [Longimicrobiaceae bacterium]
MAIRDGGLKRKSKVEGEIPSSSLADIAFLLLIFFMVTTVFRTEQKREIERPEAEATEKVDERRKNIMHVWIEPDGSIFINDRRTEPVDIVPLVRQAYIDTDRRLIVAIRADRDVPYRVINEVTEALRDAGALRVNFATDLEQRMGQARR